MQGQLWDSAVLMQWVAAINTPSLRAVHMGTEIIRQVPNESQKAWLAHARGPPVVEAPPVLIVHSCRQCHFLLEPHLQVQWG